MTREFCALAALTKTNHFGAATLDTVAWQRSPETLNSNSYFDRRTFLKAALAGVGGHHIAEAQTPVTQPVVSEASLSAGSNRAGRS